MSAKTKLVAIAAGLAALVGLEASATAQYNPPPNPQGGIVGAIINQYRYGQYPYGNYGYQQARDRQAVDQCARAVETRLSGRSYGNWGYGGQRYNRYRNAGRVEGITRVERRNNGVKVWGVASSGWGGYDGYQRQNYGSFGYHAGADLKWDCRVDRRGRVRDVDITRRTADWRGY